MTPGKTGAASTTKLACSRPRHGYQRCPRGPEESGRGLRREYIDLSIDRRRRDVHRDQRRARRRRLSIHLDQSQQSRDHRARRRPGRDHHRQWRRDLEFLVQPADRAVLSRDHRQSVSLLGLRRPAGERLRRHRQPQRLRRRSRFATGITVGVEEYGYVAPDPLDPNIIYGGKATRFNQTTGDVQNIAPVHGA